MEISHYLTRKLLLCVISLWMAHHFQYVVAEHDLKDGEFQSLKFGDSSLDLIPLPKGEHIVAIIEWKALGPDGRLRAPRQYRSLVNLTIPDDSPVYLGQFEVTQDLYKSVMGHIPSHLPGSPTGKAGTPDEYPVYFVSPNDALQFCGNLTAMAHAQGLIPLDWAFRLPTREEWQLAAQEGVSHETFETTQKPWKWGIHAGILEDPGRLIRQATSFHDHTFMFDKLNFDRPRKVKAKSPNALGFYQIFGNVEEFTSDPVSRLFYLSGGSVVNKLENFVGRAVFSTCSANYRTKATGFRVVLSHKYHMHLARPLEDWSYRHAHDFEYQVKDYSGLHEYIREGITDMVIGHNGDLWVAADRGLLRFHGTSLDVYDNKDSRELKDYSVRDLEADAHGRIWAVLPRINHIAVYCGGQFHNFPIDVQGQAEIIKKGPEDTMWVRDASTGLTRFDGCPCPDCQGRVTYFDKSFFKDFYKNFLPISRSEVITDINKKGYNKVRLEDNQKNQAENNELAAKAPVNDTSSDSISDANPNEWFTNGFQLVHIASNQEVDMAIGLPEISWPIYDIRDSWLTSISHGIGKSVWVKNTILLNYSREENWSYFPNPHFKSQRRISWSDPQGGIWLSGRNAGSGLWRISEGPLHSITVDSGITPGSGNSVASDNQGGLWLATHDGLTHISRAGEIMPYHFKDDTQSSSGSVISNVYQDSAGRVWVGLFGMAWKVPPYTRPSGEILAGNTAIRLFEDDRFVDLSLPYPLELTRRIYAIHEDADGTMWFGCKKGLVKYARNKDHRFYSLEHGLPDGWIKMIYSDSQNRLWLGMNSAGLVLMDTENDSFKTFTHENGLSSNSVMSAHEDSDGRLWFGTLEGLTCLENGIFTPVLPEDGLIGSEIGSIFEDNFGYMWLGTDKGIVRCLKHQLLAFLENKADEVFCERFGIEDGAENEEGTVGFWPSAYQFPDGRMVFPVREGFEMVDPAVIPKKPIPPDIRFHRVITYAREEANTPVELPITDNQVIIKPGDNSGLEIQFGALDLINPDGVEYRYKISELSREWTLLGRKNSLFLGNLKPGNYSLLLDVRNFRKSWGGQPAVLGLSVMPSLTQTMQFRASMVVAAAGGIFLANLGFVRHQRKKRKREQIEELKKHQEWMNRDLHDEIGNDFAQLNAILFSMKNDLKSLGKQSAHFSEYLNKLDFILRTGTSNLRRILWMTDPGKDGLENLVEFIIRLFDNSFRMTPVAVRITAPEKVPEIHVSPVVRHAVVCIVKELISNILRHSNAGTAYLEIKIDTPGQLTLIISDDGIGLPPLKSDLNSGNGLKNIHARAEQAGIGLFIDENHSRFRIHVNINQD